MTVCGTVSSLFKSGYPPLVKIPNFKLNLIKLNLIKAKQALFLSFLNV